MISKISEVMLNTRNVSDSVSTISTSKTAQMRDASTTNTIDHVTKGNVTIQWHYLLACVALSL